MATADGTVGQTAQGNRIWEWMTTGDHKKIATLQELNGITFSLIGLVNPALVRTQLAVPEGNVIDADLYNQLFSTHALTMIFLAIMPLGASFFNYFIPLHIGARDVAFPRLNMLGYWLYLTGGVMLTSSFFFGG